MLSPPPQKKTVVVGSMLLFLGIIIINIIQNNTPFRNSYIFDIKNEMKNFTTQDDKTFIDGKEFYRLRLDKTYSNNYIMNNNISYHDMILLFHKFSLSGKTLNYISFENNGHESFKRTKSKEFPALKKILSFYTNKKRNKKIVVYQYKSNGFQESEFNIDNNKTDNLIHNGNIEEVQDYQTTLKQFSRWISNGADYYKRTDVKIPKNSFLLPMWTIPPKDNYLKLYADSKNVINGKYSLNISFPEHNTTSVFLLNTYPSTPGRLKLLIKNLGNKTTIRVGRWDFNDKKGYTPPFSTYYFFLEDDKTHLINIEVKAEEYIGKDNISSFLLIGNDANILIDDISFCPTID